MVQLEPNTGLEPFKARFAAIVNQEWDQRESKKSNVSMKKATLKYPAADLDSHHTLELGQLKHTCL